MALGSVQSWNIGILAAEPRRGRGQRLGLEQGSEIMDRGWSRGQDWGEVGKCPCGTAARGVGTGTLTPQGRVSSLSLLPLLGTPAFPPGARAPAAALLLEPSANTG